MLRSNVILVFRVLSFLVMAPTCRQALDADIACPPIFGDHMVLQREQPIVLWGTAAPGESVTARFADQAGSATADDAGRWRIELPALPASNAARTLTIEGTNRLEFSDVLVGEVWLCSGQSNMEKPLGLRKGQKPTDDWEAEVAAADHPRLRLHQVAPRGKASDTMLAGRWTPCTPQSIQATHFSAVGYFFGRELVRELDVPVGMIHASLGGTMIEAWIPPDAFARDPKVAPFRERRYPAWVDGVQATELYASMIEPLVPFTVRGFLWYQGEANLMDGDGRIYANKMRALVEGWRAAWGTAEAPFYFVQLAPFGYSTFKHLKKPLTADALPQFWEVQARALAIPHTSLVVTTDLAGDATDIHPTNKRDVGLRLAGLALTRAYGRTAHSAGFAQFVSSMQREDGALVLHFKNTGGALCSRDGAPLTYFQVAGRDRRFVPAQAQVEGDTVVVRCPEVPQPVAVRFAWDEKANPNLVNADGLPVVPFRTDGWPVMIERPMAANETTPPKG